MVVRCPRCDRSRQRSTRRVSAVATPENTLPAKGLQNRGIEETRPNNYQRSVRTRRTIQMITNPFQKKAYDAVAAALPFEIDPSKITVEPGVSYLPSPIKLHDYAAGIMAAFGSVVERLGRVRGLPAQTLTLNRRLCGFHLNGLQVQFLNGYPIILDNWPLGPDNGTYR